MSRRKIEWLQDVKHLLGYSQESEQSMEAADLFVTTLTIIFKHIERCKIYLNKTRFLLYLYRVFYFRFSSVGFNRLKNKLLAEYLRNRGNELATVQISAICGAMLSNNSL